MSKLCHPHTITQIGCAACAVLLALLPLTSAHAFRGGQHQFERPARTSINANHGAHFNNQQFNNNRRINNNRQFNDNRQINDNRSINVNRNINIDNHYDRPDYYDHPIATAAAVTAAATVTAAVVGSIVYSLPHGCSTTIINGVGYQQCGTTWYEPQYSGTQVNYIVVNPPR